MLLTNLEMGTCGRQMARGHDSPPLNKPSYSNGGQDEFRSFSDLTRPVSRAWDGRLLPKPRH